MINKFILMHTSGCHLCELAEGLLKNIQQSKPSFRYSMKDISEDASLVENYGVRIPVLVVFTKEESVLDDIGWPFNQEDALLFIERYI